MTKNDNFSITGTGELFRNSDLKTIRPNFARTYGKIETGQQLCSTLRAGEYAWPGGYPMYFVTSDGAAMHFECVKENLYSVIDSIRRDISDGWKVIGTDINYEDGDLTCDHCNERIESAYADD